MSAIFSDDALWDLAIAPRTNAVARIVLLTALYADENGIATWDSDTLRQAMATGVPNGLSFAGLDRHIELAVEFGHLLPGSDRRRTMIDPARIRRCADADDKAAA